MFRTIKRVVRKSAAIPKLLENIYTILGRKYIESILSSEKYSDPLRLERFGFKVYSQNDEDGIVQEIFKRIGASNQYFVEFGVQDGLENNTRYLLNKGWKGVWLEADEHFIKKINKTFASHIKQGRLKSHRTFVTRDNINDTIKGFSLPKDLDLLSIDIDGNDYHIWESITCISPRVVIIEYNAKFPPSTRWIMDYDQHHTWDGSDNFGASLSSLTDLADTKGYSLVCCSITGVNAFFVRNDLVENKFQAPFTDTNFYEPARYYLTQAFFAGHPSVGKT